MREMRRGKKVLAVALSALLWVSGLPAAAFAQEQTPQGLCQHHPAHTADCGYVKAQPCEHQVKSGSSSIRGGGGHIEACYTSELTCGYEEEGERTASGSEGAHTHSLECRRLDCPHQKGEHDGACGYEEGSPCGYICELCGEPSNAPKGEETRETACPLTEECTLAAGHEGSCVTEQLQEEQGTIMVTAFEGLDNKVNYAPLETSWEDLNLPAKLGAWGYEEAAGAGAHPEPKEISIEGVTWEVFERNGSPSAYEEGRLSTCVYWLRAVLPEGYQLAEGAALPEIELRYGLMLRSNSTARKGEFLITGSSTQYSWAEPVLTIKKGANLTIQNADPQTPTVHRIKVEAGTEETTIALEGVNIDLSNATQISAPQCAFDMTGAQVNLIIEASSVNTFKSTAGYAGIQVPEGAVLEISGVGELNAESMSGGAGIGGSTKTGMRNSGSISIGETVHVKAASESGAAIGGADSGNSGTITFMGEAHVEAVSESGAAIGGGTGGSIGAKSIITIQDKAHVEAVSVSGAAIGGGFDGAGGNVSIQNNAHVEAVSRKGAAIGGGVNGAGGSVSIQNNAYVEAVSESGAAIGGGVGYASKGGDVKISGEGVHVKARSESGNDIGGGTGTGSSDGGTLSVTDGATLEMQNTGTNADKPTYKSCTIIQGGRTVEYKENGTPKAVPTLTLSVQPQGSLTLPGMVRVMAVFNGGDSGNNSAKKLTFTAEGVGAKRIQNVATNSDGEALFELTNPSEGTYTFKVSFAGDGANRRAEAAPISGYTVQLGTQDALTFQGLAATYAYGDAPFALSVSGGSTQGAVTYGSDDESVASVTGNEVTIHNAGACTITATKAGDSLYKEVTAARQITVSPRDISHVTVSVPGSWVYTGSPLEPAVEVRDGNIPITGSDYSCSYSANVDAGSGRITLTGQGNYKGTKTVEFPIEKRPLDRGSITLEGTVYTQTAGEIRPAVTGVVVDGITVPSTAYEVEYANNTGIGTATVTVRAKGNSGFSGWAATTFEIVGTGDDASGDAIVTAPGAGAPGAGNEAVGTASRSHVQGLASGGGSLTIEGGGVKMTFGPAALSAILAAVPATAEEIRYEAAPADLSGFPEAAKLIGSRPVYSFTISYRDSGGNWTPVSVNFPAGSVTIALNYIPGQGEEAGSLFIVYVDGNGVVTWLEKSVYEAGRMKGEAPHFSVYGVAYRGPSPEFEDTEGHWAQGEIEFAWARGLMVGTGEGRFSPDAAVTRGMLVTALGRLAGVRPESYPARSFTDVSGEAYYSAYAEWSVEKGIAGATGERQFSPEAPVSRQEMAVMTARWVREMGYSLGAPLEAVSFVDSDKISPWAAGEVTAMVQAGVMKGRDGNVLDPQGAATRGEASAMLSRLVGMLTEPGWAAGWSKNDSGSWLYYENGKALTGWQTIGGQRYYFDGTGEMHEGWKQEPGNGSWRYWTKAGVVTGWREIEGRWYYFYEDGVMAVNTKIDGYEIGPDGAMK